MNNILDLFMGDPIYDERKRVVGRDFGVKNIIAIVIVLYIGNLLMCKMKPKSEKKQMKGGLEFSEKTLDTLRFVGAFLLCMGGLLFGIAVLTWVLYENGAFAARGL